MVGCYPTTRSRFEVVTAVGKNIRSEEMVVLVVGNADLFDEPLDSLGLDAPVPLDITIPDPN